MNEWIYLIMWNKQNNISLDTWPEYRPHRRNTKACLWFFGILGISAKRPVNWDIFIYQRKKSKIATRPHFTGTTHIRGLPQLFLRDVLRATGCLLPLKHYRPWFWEAQGPRNREMDKMSGNSGTFPDLLLADLSFNGFLWNMGIQLRHSSILS